MTLFLLSSVPVVTLLLAWYYSDAILKEKIPRIIVSSFGTGVIIFLIHLPFIPLAQFHGDFVFFFFGSLFVQFLGPCVAILFIYSWLILRQNQSTSQGSQILELTCWLGSYFSIEGLQDVLFYRRTYDMTELFFFPLLRLLILVWVPFCFVRYRGSGSFIHKALWALAIGGLMLFGASCILLSYAQLTLLVWGLLGVASCLSFFWLKKFLFHQEHLASVQNLLKEKIKL